MDEIISKRVVYNREGKLEGITRSIKLPEKIAGIDRYDYAYDYNYDITEDDNYYDSKIGDNNVTYKKNHLTLNFSGFSFAAFTISSILLSVS
jgi:hypothetical protein